MVRKWRSGQPKAGENGARRVGMTTNELAVGYELAIGRASVWVLV